MLWLSAMSCAAAVMIVAGFKLPLFDRLIRPHRWRIPVNERFFHASIWMLFLAFCVVTFATAYNIPIIAALKGGLSQEELDIQRGAFLKTREGWGSGLGYVSAVFVGTLLPYSLARLFWTKKPIAGFSGLALFAAYTLSYLQKALIIQAVAPLLYLSGRRLIWNYLGLFALTAGTLGIFYANTVLAVGVKQEEKVQKKIEERRQASLKPDSRGNLVPPNFFSSDFKHTSTKEYLVWRAVAVPIFTAADAVKVFHTKFNSKPLLGATSSPIAAIFGMKRVNYDAEVFAAQWGESNIGRSNSVYVTDGYVNFGWAGVVVFSIFVGLGFRVFALSGDEALRSMWPLFAFNVIQASFIGSLLSGGFIFLFIIAFFVNLRDDHQPESKP
ncbi:hypothetical protein [Nitrobacter winogradskyi]|uniref:Uncharacterized protein n=1 Tax=Nitrobacter winogradskyi TaxID=913 RepID=A0ACC6AEJ4_NITWI|nr:hypothetical protein [Nitrobacter winogradskyi]MCP1998272.1 hypothetical protein [Nitrobacter winogradskyi]